MDKKITNGYNTILFGVFFLFQSAKSLLEYKDESGIVIDKMFESEFAMSMMAIIILFVVSSAIGVWIIKSFWERLISRIFHVRNLNTCEAISILLVMLILSVN
ncbi:hypothetical protein [Pseudodesulfovibrio tunisiensis]|uniref:hypothetical protein n=1 Tax=Pseudodesulfovibrio tunisiensis TaxID=463192 RepID=UPI001FB55CE8|nr:hypothetical protein [Pseudodesulfovibrio tunisiensis]